ncbi:G protein-coupled glucose receptor regulating Gpa2-domain-containing protein [Scheffersomyces xylosifermentans]|uniref:G protein-coupled glucose receptor regulating Gpa2-domain-containing protein n=1 Tax=Scheffersomyces xylosifermentans TaxID=1304137 RepID=UPI00315C8797
MSSLPHTPYISTATSALSSSFTATALTSIATGIATSTNTHNAFLRQSTASPISPSNSSSIISSICEMLFATSEHLIKRMTKPHNQIDEFTDRQAMIQRILATSSSCASITLCLAAFYAFLAIDPRRLIFRHQLIFFLLFFDMLKAIILLLYPTRVLTHSSSYYNDNFCQVVGFFTATAIEGADIAILAFAVHTYLLIFKPSLTTKVKNSTRTEGGLYKYRLWVYAASFLIPIVLASLAFVNGTGYISLVCWCYLPQRPLWYRFVLSWVPRYCIVIIIFVFYAFIYYHVIKEFKTLGGVFTTMHKSHGSVHPKLGEDENPGLYSSLKYFVSLIADTAMPKFVFPTEDDTSVQNTHQSLSREPSVNRQPKDENDDDDDDEDVSDLSTTPVHVDTENIIYDPELHAANLENFRKRQKIIQKQMKSIFVYPFAYCFLWLFPFILHVTQVNYEERHGPIFWINCMGAFFQPLNGFVDALVFFYREQPWKYTIMKNFEKEHMTRVDNMLVHHGHHHTHPTSTGSEGHDGTSDSIATSARWTKNSLSTTAGLVDIQQYSKWRQWANSVKLPLFTLPTEENISKFQVKYINGKIRRYKSIHASEGEKAQEKIGAGINNISAKHDFSNVLNGDLNEGDFRKNLHSFTLNFNVEKSLGSSNKKRGSVGGTSSSHSNRKGSIISCNKSMRDRLPSESTDPIALHGNNETRRMSLSTNTMMSSINGNLELRPLQKRSATTGLPVISTPKRSHTSSVGLNGSASRNSTTSSAGALEEEDDEIDFMEFLKKGPPHH